MQQLETILVCHFHTGIVSPLNSCRWPLKAEYPTSAL